MSKNYDLYPKYERKVDNWRRRILGYEKMKRDLQKQIQILKSKNKKQKEVIDKAVKYIDDSRDESAERQEFYNCFPDDLYIPDIDELLDILNEEENDWNMG